MSAFILTDKHFSTIANYAHAMVDAIDPQALADKLKRINIESVNYRYREKTRITKCKLTVNPMPVHDVIQLINCWDYQSCENRGNIEFHILSGYLYSFFTEEQIKASADQSKVWSI